MIADLHDFLEAVRNINDGNPGGEQLPHDFEQHLDFRSRKGRRRLIHDQNPQVVLDQISRDLNHLLLPDTKVTDNRVRINLMLQPAHDRFSAFSVGSIVKERPVLLFMAHENVLVNCHRRKKTQLLMDDSNSFRPGGVRILKADFLTVHVHLAGGRLLDPCNNLHQGRFSSAVLADQHIDLVFQQIKAHLIECLRSGINLVYLLTMQNHIGIIKHVRPPGHSTVISTGVTTTFPAVLSAAPVSVITLLSTSAFRDFAYSDHSVWLVKSSNFFSF